jgi:protein toll
VEIQCPKFDSRIFVRIQPNNFLSLECENSTENDYKLIPQMTMPEAQMIKLIKCPLLHDKSLTTYIQNLNIQKVLWLQIFSSGANNMNRLERQHLEGFEDITRFHLSGSEGEFSELPSDLFMNLTKVSWVTIRVNGIQLPEQLFSPLTNLEFLELGHNKMTSLERGLLANNRKLQRLSLWGNNLRALDKESFKGLENLYELDLSTNGMESIGRDLFAYLGNLTHLNLGGNNFVSLPEGLFANNPKLTSFRLLENREIIDTLPDAMFANKTKLAEIFIKCRLRKIPENLLEGSAMITNIKLGGNELEVLSEILFKDQVNLEILDLSENMLTELPDKIFEKTSALRELILNDNHLTKISSYVFQTLTKLTSLSIENNQLKILEKQCFLTLGSVKYLNLANNQLSFETDFADMKLETASRFQGLKAVEHLILRNNSFSQIFEDYTLGELKELDMSYNNITHFMNSDLQFITKNSLRFDLRHNQIKEIGFQSIIELDKSIEITVLLDHNPLNCDCLLLHFVKFLHREQSAVQKSPIKIDTSNMRCASPGRMEGKELSSLHPLNLTCLLDDASSSKEKRCPSRCISCEVRPDDQTLLMDCHGNVSIDLLPIASKINLKYVKLRLNSQNLTEIPSSATPAFRQITSLFLRNNAIRHVTELPPNLIELDLRNNDIEVMNETIIALLNTSTLEALSLSGNPWKCECETLDFINFAWNIRDKIRDYNEMTCANGEFLNNLSKDDLCTRENLIIIIGSIILAISSLLIGVLAALYYKYQKQIKMWLYSHNLCLWFVTEEELDKDKTYDAFVSYAHQDGDFITDHLVPQLENCAVPYKLCLHERDWLPGLEISCKLIKFLILGKIKFIQFKI